MIPEDQLLGLVITQDQTLGLGDPKIPNVMFGGFHKTKVWVWEIPEEKWVWWIP